MFHIPATKYHLPAAIQEAHQKAYFLTKSVKEFSGKKSGEWACTQKKRKDRKSNGSRQKTKRRDSKVESNDSREIPT